ncbi:MAG: hypothetical protein U0414_41165 [Polyangiaceae bacterium]
MRSASVMGFVVAAALVLGACGDKGADGVGSASPDKATSATGKSASPAGGGSAKPSTSTATQPPRSGANASGPLAPLADLGKQVDDGLKSFIDGKDLAAAFPGWSATAKDEAKLRADLKDAGATSGTTAFMEFELILQKADKVVYYLRTGVLPSEAAFVEFGGRAETQVDVTTHDLSEFTGETAPLKTAASALFDLVKGADCEKVPFASAEAGEKLGGGEIAEELLKTATKAKGDLSKTCKEIAAAGADKVRLRIDDFGVLVRGADGKAVGQLSGQFELKDGKLVLGLKRFKPFKK